MTCDFVTAAAIARVAECYKVPAAYGAIVTVNYSPAPRTGHIVGADQMSLICSDVVTGEEFKIHPTWKTTYADMAPDAPWAEGEHRGREGTRAQLAALLADVTAAEADEELRDLINGGGA